VEGLRLGQLSIKEEAAGKVRVFALVDIWTQSFLKPVHEHLFSILRTLPNDGTFDQQASVKRCVDKVAKSGKSFGYDLSAATDRLPIYLQIKLLSSLFNEEVAVSWARLLVNREYVLNHGEYGSECVKYSTGQPMGALSSWAMLALTHHMLVQIACQRARGFKTWRFLWYDNYELLGDDIVIFDADVADSYLNLMAQIGVPINLSKSVVANNATTEFAKVTTHFGKNVSALS
jgi:hypothetical protein